MATITSPAPAPGLAPGAGARPVPTAAAGPGAARLAEGMLGIGLLLVPPLGAALAGPGGAVGGTALAAWALVCVFSLSWCLVIGAAGGTERSGPIAFVRERLGPRAATAGTAMYLGGFVVGQAAIALAAGAYAAHALARFAAAGPRSNGVPFMAYPIGASVLLTAAVLAWRGVALSAHARRVRLIMVLALAWSCWLRPDLLTDVAGVGHSVQDVLQLGLLMLFAAVGMESAVPASAETTAPTRRMLIGAVAGGIAVVGAVYAVPLQPLPATDGPVSAGTEVTRALLGLLAAAVCGAYCLTNLRAAAGFLGELRAVRSKVLEAERPATSVWWPAGAALLVLGLAAARGWDSGTLLTGPAVMTLAIYSTMLFAACGRQRPRPEALLAAVLLLAFAYAAGLTLLLPAAALLTAWLLHRSRWQPIRIG